MNTKGLLEWFSREGTAYPWGENNAPYRVWISEIMLQQTVVTAVIPFFNRWMERFPDLGTLAAAGEGEVLRLWEGLGYYSRARNILKSARIILEDLGGEFPSEYKELTALPGIGDYTASAILSISFNQSYPVIDANVKRICQRLENQEEWDKDFEVAQRKRLNGDLPADSPGEFNSALMQLGQLVCRTGTPQCDGCPLREDCRAYHTGRESSIPKKKTKKISEIHSRVLIFHLVHTSRHLFWIIQRKEGIGRGLWTFPRLHEEEDLPSGWKVTEELTGRTHNYTRFRERLAPFILDRGQKNALPTEDVILPFAALREGEGFWATRGELEHLAVPAVYRKIIEELLNLPE